MLFECSESDKFLPHNRGVGVVTLIAGNNVELHLRQELSLHIKLTVESVKLPQSGMAQRHYIFVSVYIIIYTQVWMLGAGNL